MTITDEIDLYDPDGYVDGPPHEVFEHLRREQPVYRQAMPDGTAYWAVLRHADVTTVAVPVGRQVTTLTGSLEELLADPAHERFVDRWVAARLTDDTVQTQPMERLRARFPHAVSLRYDDPRTGAIVDFGSDGPPVEERSDESVVLEFLEEVRDRPPSDSERRLVLAALDEAHRGAQA